MGGFPANSSPAALRFFPKPNATLVLSPLAGTGVPAPDPGAGDDSLTILENPGFDIGDPVFAGAGMGDADADGGVAVVGNAVKPVMSIT